MLICNNTRRTRTSKWVQYYISGVAAGKDEKLSQLLWITSRMLNSHLFTKLLHKTVTGGITYRNYAAGVCASFIIPRVA